MSIAISDLKLPADKIAQIEKSLGGDPTDLAAPNLQNICDEAFADVGRLTTGYVIDPTSITNFTRALALYRAYGYIGTVPKDVQRNHDDAKAELEAIAQGKRPNLPKTETTAQTSISGKACSRPPLPGRLCP